MTEHCCITAREFVASVLRFDPMRKPRGVALVLGVLLLATLGSSPAQAAGEEPIESLMPATLRSHFYTLGLDRIPMPSGSPYLTAIGPTTVLTIDWDVELARVDIATRESASLGVLPLPAGSRVLDFISDGPVRGTDAPVMVAYSVKDEAGCRRLTMQEATVDLTGAQRNTLGRVWWNSPCYPFRDGMFRDGLSQSGGRIVKVPARLRDKGAPARQYFLSVGDFELSNIAGDLSKRDRGLLSTIQLVTAPNTSRTYAKGLRNVQGMTIATIDGRVSLVASEHGPRGGDDINVIVDGRDYGWPKVSYGADYGTGKASNRPANEGTHRGAELPLFSFVPSIGPTSVIQVRGPAFRTWWGSRGSTSDLLVNGMGARQLARLRVDDGAVRVVVGIPINVRLRSLIQMPSGVLVGGADNTSSELVVIRPSEVWDSNAEAFRPVG